MLIVSVAPTNNVDPSDDQSVVLNVTRSYAPANQPLTSPIIRTMNTTTSFFFNEVGPAAPPLGARGRPVIARVRQWAHGLPQYRLGHGQRVAALLETPERLPGASS